MSKEAEVIRLKRLREQKIPPASSVGLALEQLVEQKVSQILSDRSSALFEPWFRTRKEAAEIRRRQTVPEQRKWSIFYENNGCLRCSKNTTPHASNGLCRPCRGKIEAKLAAIIKNYATNHQS